MSRAVAAAFQSPFSAGGARGHRTDYDGPVDTVYLGCWPKRTFDVYGLFDEDLVRNQDDEHNLRILRAGGIVWQSSLIRSFYAPRGSLTALFRQYYQYGYWKVRVIRKHRLPASFRHLVPGLFVVSLSACLLGSPFVPLLGFLGLLEAGAYLIFLLAASAVTAGRTEWRLAPLLPAVFATFHVGYGVGFLRGLGDFVLRLGVPSESAARLTRNDGKQPYVGAAERRSSRMGKFSTFSLLPLFGSDP
jgi:hypothetical protein